MTLLPSTCDKCWSICSCSRNALSCEIIFKVEVLNVLKVNSLWHNKYLQHIFIIIWVGSLLILVKIQEVNWGIILSHSHNSRSESFFQHFLESFFLPIYWVYGSYPSFQWSNQYILVLPTVMQWLGNPVCGSSHEIMLEYQGLGHWEMPVWIRLQIFKPKAKWSHS